MHTLFSPRCCFSKQRSSSAPLSAAMVLVKWLVLLLVATTCIDAAYSEDVAGLRSGVWDVGTLVPGKGSVPPFHELHIEAGHWALRQRNSSRVSQLLESAAAQLGVIYTAVPREEVALCHAGSSPRWEWAATRTDDGLAVECLPTGWFTTSALRTFARNGFLHLHFDTPQPLAVAVNGTCAATTWAVHDVLLAKVSEDSVVMTGTLSDNAVDGAATCKAFFEVTRRPTVATAEKSSSSGIYAPIALLVVVIAVRLLPRYILTRTGQIDRGSYRGRNPAKLSAARRAELLEKQRRIIEQMKAEDRANAPKEKST